MVGDDDPGLQLVDTDVIESLAKRRLQFCQDRAFAKWALLDDQPLRDEVDDAGFLCPRMWTLDLPTGIAQAHTPHGHSNAV